MEPIQFVREGLGNSSYLIPTADGEAVVIDPDRDVRRYLLAASQADLRITGIVETHLHADFVSGSREIAARTGATLFAPADSHLAFPYTPVRDRVPFRAGDIVFEPVASPGHTLEHLSYVVRLPLQAPLLFSGGALIVGGAARTDLIAPDQTDGLTRAQYRTITQAFAHLPDTTVLLPTHGGGSFCSSGAGGERTSTLGHERQANPLMRVPTEDEFAAWFPTTFPAVPAYFTRMRPLNQRGPRLRSEIASPPNLDAAEFNAAARRGGVIIDTRPQAEFMRGHIPGAISNTLREGFATWLGWLVPEDARLFFVADSATLDEVIEQSLLVGYEQFGGVLASGMEGWERAGLPIREAPLISAREAAAVLADGGMAVDVREPTETLASVIPGAATLPLGELAERAGTLPRDRPLVLYCGHGERSATGLSLLERAGFTDLYNLDGGIGAWAEVRESSAPDGG